LAVRVFDDKVARRIRSTDASGRSWRRVQLSGLCAVGHDANKSRIYRFDEMDADHVSAWSKGGESSAMNCQMLCTPHNRAKGNR
ncbi:MAG: HNH endonuclease, partial [Anaerolineae bacterium]|nr:HNH endonuclease [Anaerolineae bacterium]